MKKKFTIGRQKGRYARAIRYGKQWVLSLTEGAVINEHYIHWIIDRLNGAGKEPPERIRP